MKSSTLFCLLAMLLPATTLAHTPYLAPADFSVRQGGSVSLDAAFAERFFVAQTAFNDSQFAVVGPDGKRATLDNVQYLRTRTVAEHKLTAKGTYRFSTGPRLGAIFRTWEQDGKRKSSRDRSAPLPAGAKLVSEFQSLTLAETYVTVAAPDRVALQPYGHGLELVPITHPNDLYVGEAFVLLVQYEGKPLADQKVDISEAVWSADRKPETITLLTDAQGRVSVNLQRAGTWLALTRYRSNAPEGAAAAQYSNSYTLSFNVLEQ